jgi:hypothetical protein
VLILYSLFLAFQRFLDHSNRSSDEKVMVKVLTVMQREQYPYGSYTVPYRPYELFQETIIKKVETNLIDSLLIYCLFTIKEHFQQPLEVFLDAPNLRIVTATVRHSSIILEVNQEIKKSKHSRGNREYNERLIQEHI